MTNTQSVQRWGLTLLIRILIGIVLTALPLSAKTTRDSLQLQADYIERVRQAAQPQPKAPAPGSLWVDGAVLGEMSSDYKARGVGDNVVIVVIHKTTAQSSGNVNTQRAFQANSKISGLPGRIGTGGVDPLFAADTGNTLKGQGASSNTSNLATSLSARVVAVLPGGNLVVEAQRDILMNSQRETMIVRGVLRPGDIGSNNTVLSSMLANLEIELKGKGVISDATRRPNLAVRVLMWLVSF